MLLFLGTKSIFLIAHGLVSASYTVSKAPFTLPKILGTVRIKMVRVPEDVALIRRLHTLFSAGPSIAKFGLVRVPGSKF